MGALLNEICKIASLVVSARAAIVLSVGLALGSALLFRFASPSRVVRLVFAVAAFCCLELIVLYRFVDAFTGAGIDEAALFHISHGVSGAGFGAFLWPISEAIVLSAAALAASFLAAFRLPKGSPVGWVSRVCTALSFIVMAVATMVSPTASDICSWYVLKTSAETNAEQLDAYRGFLEAYRQPIINRIDRDIRPKNLVVIYAESLERTYFDEGMFPGLMIHLRELQGVSTRFMNIRQVAGTHWTVAGMTASLCGLALFTPSHVSAMSGMDQFLSSATCMTDLLRSEGYDLVYMGGSSLDFAGKGTLLRNHGFGDVMGRDELALMLPPHRFESSWGVSDDDLLEMVYRHFLTLSSKPQPFGLFTLTLDTHHPDGYIPADETERYRYGDGSNPMLNAIMRADDLIANLVDKILASPYANRTIIAIVSDHLAMPNAVTDIISKADRTNLMMIIDPSAPVEVVSWQPGSLLDFAPTLLPFVGYDASIGLGRNLLADDAAAEAERERIQQRMSTWRLPIMDFWGFPRVQESISIEPDGERVRIDGRSFSVPVLIEFDDALSTVLKFDAYRSPGDVTVVEHAKALKGDVPYALIDRCAGICEGGMIEKGSRECASRWCVVLATGSKIHRAVAVDKPFAISASELREVFALPSRFEPLRVAHAGGGIDGETYTNSYEALDRAVNDGFRYLELDLSFTSDDQLVCIHDWKQNFETTFGMHSRGAVSLSEFQVLVRNNSRHTNCTLVGLARWMTENPGAIIVTDVKERNLEALGIIARTLPDAARRVIPQIYMPEEYEPVKSLGFQRIIWTLYRYPGDDADVLGWVDRLGRPLAVTMPRDRAASALPLVLARKGIATYVHTINDVAELSFFKGSRRVTEVYTDVLRPGQQPGR